MDRVKIHVNSLTDAFKNIDMPMLLQDHCSDILHVDQLLPLLSMLECSFISLHFKKTLPSLFIKSFLHILLKILLCAGYQEPACLANLNAELCIID